MPKTHVELLREMLMMIRCAHLNNFTIDELIAIDDLLEKK